MMYTELKQAVIEGKPRLAVQIVQEALDSGADPREILEEGLLPGIHAIGREAAASDTDIARILACARAVKRALNELEPHMQRALNRRGKVIIGTAGGDLHDVGKNIVAIMFEGVGYEVVDLGVDVPAGRFVEALKENRDANLICISCLLTTSMPEMEHIVSSLRKYRKKYDFRVMVGGAPVTAEFARKIGADLYTENAVEAAERASELLD